MNTCNTFVRLVSVCILLLLSLASNSLNAAEHFNGLTKLSGTTPENDAINIVYVRVGRLYIDFPESSQQALFERDVASSATFRDKSPFSEYSSYLNVFRADIHQTNISWPYNIEENKVLVLNNLLGNIDFNPDIIVFMVYSGTLESYCDSGHAIGCYVGYLNGNPDHAKVIYLSGARNDLQRVTVHELGHAIGGLADEYFSQPLCERRSGDASNYSGFADERNLSLSNNITNLKWRRWLVDNGGDLNLPVEGGQGCIYGVYRPSPNSVMNQGNDFDSVGREAVVLGLNAEISENSILNPEKETLSFPVGVDNIQLTAIVNPHLSPQGGRVELKWFKFEGGSFNDIVPLSQTGESIMLDISDLNQGEEHLIVATTYDPDLNNLVKHGTSSHIGVGHAPLCDINDNCAKRWVVKREVSPTPIIDNIQPAIVDATGYYEGDDVIIHGRFLCGTPCTPSSTVVDVNGVEVMPKNISDYSIRFTIPVGSAGGFVTVSNHDGQFTSYTAIEIGAFPSPNITHLTSARGQDLPFNPGELVFAHGFNLCTNPCDLSLINVKIGDIDIPNIITGHNTFVMFYIPLDAKSGDLVVSTPYGDSNKHLVTINKLPAITGVYDNAGNSNDFTPGEIVLLHGTDLCGTPCDLTETQVSIGGTNISNLTYGTSTLLLFTIPAGATTGDLVVTTGTGASSPLNITIQSPPEITYVFNADGDSNNFNIGDNIMVHGSELCPLPCELTKTQVSIGGTNVPLMSGYDIYLIFTVPQGITSGLLIVTNEQGTSNSVNITVH